MEADYQYLPGERAMGGSSYLPWYYLYSFDHPIADHSPPPWPASSDGELFSLSDMGNPYILG